MLAGPTRPGQAAGILTCEVLPELLLQLHGFVVDLICLLVRLPSVHFPAKDRRSAVPNWIPVLINMDCSRLPENLPSCPESGPWLNPGIHTRVLQSGALGDSAGAQMSL